MEEVNLGPGLWSYNQDEKKAIDKWEMDNSREIQDEH